ncbi:MAG: putative sensor protein [Pedosphaera sp.]|nr:putative sensor protein [Pedosphaera sp.]
MNRGLRVLVIEDSEDDTHFLLRELKRAGFEPSFERVDTAVAMVASLRKQPWDVIVSDHSMPGFGSIDALEVLKKAQLDIPFIVVSGAIGEDIAVNMMKAGANDYVMKGNLARLVPSIERELREAESRGARRRAEKALKSSQSELEDFFEHAALGLHWAGPDGTILRANRAELELLGYSREEYVGRKVGDFHVDDGVGEDILRRLKAGETLANYEARLRCKDGSTRNVLINANVLWENDKFIHTRCFTRDITDRRRASAALAHLAAIVESCEDAIIGKTLDGTIVSWNTGAERVYGYTADEVRGRSISILIPHYRPEEFPQLYDKIKKGGRTERYETVRIRKDGTTIDVSLTLSPIKDSTGKVIGVSAIERDITARKREDAERLKLIEELTDALAKIKTLRGLLPICSSCKKIRDDRGYWQKVESYIMDHTNAEFTHGICPDCLRRLYPEYKLGKQPGS